MDDSLLKALHEQVIAISDDYWDLPPGWGKADEVAALLHGALGQQGLKFLDLNGTKWGEFAAVSDRWNDSNSGYAPLCPEEMKRWSRDNPVVFHGTSWFNYCLWKKGWLSSPDPIDLLSSNSAFGRFFFTTDLEEAIGYADDNLPKEISERVKVNRICRLANVPVILSIETVGFCQIWEQIQHFVAKKNYSIVHLAAETQSPFPPPTQFIHPIAVCLD